MFASLFLKFATVRDTGTLLSTAGLLMSAVLSVNLFEIEEGDVTTILELMICDDIARFSFKVLELLSCRAQRVSSVTEKKCSMSGVLFIIFSNREHLQWRVLFRHSPHYEMVFSKM